MACDRACRRQSRDMLYRLQTLCVLCVCACGAVDGGDVEPEVDAPMVEAGAGAGAMTTEHEPVTTAACEPVACTPVSCSPVACEPVACTPTQCEPVACTPPAPPPPPAPVPVVLPLTVYSVDDPFCRITATGTAHDGELWGCRSYPTTVSNVQYPTTEPSDLIGCITPTTWPCADGSPEGCIRRERRFVADVPCAVGGQCRVFIAGHGYAGTCEAQTASQVGVRTE